MKVISSNLNWGKDNWKGILESDAKGYYAYLPAVFIYQDLNFGFLEEIQEKYPAPHLDYDYRAGANGARINKYYVGTALLQLPFFATAHWLTKLTGGDADGYSKWYLISVNIAALFYLFIGLLYLRKTLSSFKLAEIWIALLLFATTFGTNLFVYSAVEPGMSHVFSFALISLWIYQLRMIQLQNDFRRWIALALISGLIIVVRPVNVLVFLGLPFVIGDRNDFLQIVKGLFSKPQYFLLLIPAAALFPFIQLSIYKFSAGSWWVYAYGQETFNFADPNFVKILFSYKKGLFLYTPLYLLSFVGLIPLWSKDRFRFWSWWFFFLVITYVFSSWWMWFYGGSFSSRVYVEYLPFFMLLFSFSFKFLKNRKLRMGLAFAACLLIILCQIQSYQYRYYIIHYSEMNQEKYWDNFLRLKTND